MAKIVYNACYGGFGLSHLAQKEYARRKGFEIFAFTNARDADDRPNLHKYVPVSDSDADSTFFVTYFRTPNPVWDEGNHFDDGEIERDDADLIAIVEEWGARANTRHSALAIAEIPSGSLYRIDEYDGMESVMKQDDYEWKVAP